MNFFDFSTEDKKVILDKTTYMSTDPEQETTVIDNLHMNPEAEDDLKRIQAERDKTQTVPLPLFRFIDKQFVDILEKAHEINTLVKQTLTDNEETYHKIFKYINILNRNDLNHLMKLTLLRNKEVFNSSNDKKFEIEITTCYIEKRLKVLLDIPEDTIVDENIDQKYRDEEAEAHRLFEQLFNQINELKVFKESGTFKDAQFVMEQRSGGEDYGAGYSFVIRYNKPIDYANTKRGTEDFDAFERFTSDIKEESLKNNIINSRQININLENNAMSTEALNDGLTNNNGSQGNPSGSNQNSDGGFGNDDMSLDSNDDLNGADDISGENDNLGGDLGDGSDGMGGDDGLNGDQSSSGGTEYKRSTKHVAGKNPFVEINGRTKIRNQLCDLKNRITTCLIKLDKFETNNVVKEIIELNQLVTDAVNNVYSIPIQDSLSRCSWYSVYYGILVDKLTKSISEKKLESNSQN